MKTPPFWYPEKNGPGQIEPLLLSPLSWVFSSATHLRRSFAKPYKARVPVLCIGNVVAGGAGKTPTALTLARLLKDRGEKPVFVTRGYGGSHEKKNGQALCVDLSRHTAADVGDEALLLAAFAPTWVCRDRVEAVRQAESYGTYIIMDDGFQNPYIAPTASLLVVDGEVGIGNGHIIPAGPLRESLAQALKRAAGIVIIGRDKQKLAAQVKLPVFHAHLRPHLPRGFARKGRYVAFAGIGRPEKFYQTARELKLDIAETVDFPDHHVYTHADIEMLRLTAEEQGARLLTTEKDAVRLPPDFRAEVVLLPVRLVFDDSVAEQTLPGLFFDLC